MTKQKLYTGPVPFEPNGSIPNWTYDRPDDDCSKVIWRENVQPFPAILRFDGFSRGRSSANFTLSEGAAKYEMLSNDLLAAIQSGVKIEGGSISGTFAVKKRGANYSIY